MPDTSLRAQTDKQIFVSYSRKDRDTVITLYTELEALGFKVWRDLHNLYGGDKFWEKIKEAIEASETVVLCMSPAALDSKYVRAEWLYARQIGRRVIPIVVEDIDFEALPRWMSSVDWKDFREGKPERDLIWANFIHTLNTPHTPQKVPFMVEAPPFDYVPRPDVVEPVIASLEQPANKLMALKGAGGYGKTTLARVICHDERVRTAYDDGTLWVTLGEAVSEEERIAKLLDLVVELRGERPPVQTLEAAKNELRTAIGDRYLLLVVDDAWRRPDLESFLVDAPNAAVLVTTRVRTALPDRTLIHDIDAMQRDQAIRLLAFGLPEEQVARQYTQLDALAKRLGEWALMLKLTNGAIKSRMSAGNSFEEALSYVEKSLTKRGLSLSFANTEQRRNATAAASLNVSLDLLKPDERALYNRLAIFPEDVDIPLETLEPLWELDDFDTEEFARRLFDVSLLLRFDLKAKIIRMHDIVRTHLRETEADQLAEMNASFLDRTQTRYKISHWHDLPLDAPYLWQHLATHLIDAGRADTMRELLFDFGWMYAKLNATDPAALLADAVTAAKAFPNDRELRLIESALRLAQNALSEDKKQLANQMRGRLWIYKDKLEEYPTITALWDAVPDIPGTLALLPTQQFPPMLQAGGALIRTLQGHRFRVDGVLELNNQNLLSWSGDRTLRLWDQYGEQIDILEKHDDEVIGALQLRDRRILSWSSDKTLNLYDENGQFITTLEGHLAAVVGAIETSKGYLVSWAGDFFNATDYIIKLWNSQGILFKELKGHESEIESVIELSSSHLLSRSRQGQNILWSAEGERLSGDVLANEVINGITELKVGQLLSWSDNGYLKLWKEDFSEAQTLYAVKERILGAEQLNHQLIIFWTRGAIYSFDLSTMKKPKIVIHAEEIYGLSKKLNNQWIILGSLDGATMFIDEDGDLKTIAKDHLQAVTHILELKDGRIVTSSTDKSLRIWNHNGTKSAILAGHNDSVYGAIELTNRLIVSWSRDSTLRLWDPDNAPFGHYATPITDRVTGLFWLGSKGIMSWLEDGSVRIWDDTGRLEHEIRGSNAILHAEQTYMKDAIFLEQNFSIDEDKIYLNSSVFAGDTKLRMATVYSSDESTLVVGDIVGRVIFLKVVPPEE